jgi:hypothetical protein
VIWIWWNKSLGKSLACLMVIKIKNFGCCDWVDGGTFLGAVHWDSSQNLLIKAETSYDL